MRLQQQQRSQRSTRSRRLSELSKQLTQRIFLLFFGSCYRGGYCSGLSQRQSCSCYRSTVTRLQQQQQQRQQQQPSQQQQQQLQQ